jgi:hypothetical protein
MGFFTFHRKVESPEEKAARRERRAQRELENYNAIMNAFVQPLPTFSQFTAPAPRGHPPTYENAAQAYSPATYYPNQSYENPYGNQGYQYVACSPQGSVSSQERLPTYVDSMYNPWSRQVTSPIPLPRTPLTW